MKLRTPKLFNRMLSNKGYTIDQTILIVAIIAILITLVIVTVGWQLINRSSGTKAGAQLKQVEDANGQFFSSQRVWPHQAITGTPTGATNMQVLANNGITTWAANINQSDLRNLIPGFKLLSGSVYHGFGSGGIITQQANTYPAAMNIGTDTRMVIQFAGVPLAEAKEADRAVDGVEGYNVGRVIYGTAACLNNTVNGAVTTPTQATGGTVFMCYAANTVG
ncbi:MAG: hypothetical protein DI585_04110 [Pseudomonas fluorescens]|nr:MAG: hypothetical protein DI585_04110 [Pseudomonas fluorescens]